MPKPQETKSVFTSLLMKEIKDKAGTSEEIDDFLRNAEICLVDPDHNEKNLLSDTPDEDLEQITLFALKKIVEKRAGLVKRILNKQTLKTRQTCFMDIDGIEHIS